MLSYDDMMEDAAPDARAREASLFGQSITLMRGASAPEAGPAARLDAARFTERLWTRLMDDLASPDNKLPAVLRADLISIGIFVLRELGPASRGERGFGAIEDVTEQLRAGLATTIPAAAH